MIALAIIAACLTTVLIVRWRWTFERGKSEGYAERLRDERWERRRDRTP